MKRVSGLALASIGLLHSLVLVFPGPIGFSGIWTDIFEAGVIDAVDVESPRIFGFYWFIIPGLFMILVGLICHWIENHMHSPLPPFVGWTLLAISVFGIVLDTDTGFWLVLLVAINMVLASKRAEQTS